MELVYPDSTWYTVNAAWYWPFRGWEMTSDPRVVLERGQYRYFRFNIHDEYFENIQGRGAASCVMFNSISCYPVPGGMHLCEGFLEPECDGVTLGRIIENLHPAAIEVAASAVWFPQEIYNDLSDFLNSDYHTIHPVEMAGPDEKLVPGNYYPVAAWWKGSRPGAAKVKPTEAEQQALLAEQDLGYYQPFPDMDPTGTSFILFTGKRPVTTRTLQEILKADVVAVNRIPLDPKELEKLVKYDAGGSMIDVVTRFFEDAPEAAEDAARYIRWIFYAVMGGLGGLVLLRASQYAPAPKRRKKKKKKEK